MQHDFILLDRSGSMDSQWTEAINSVNNYVHELAKQNVDTGVTLAVFDSDHSGGLDFHILRDRIIPKTWHDVGYKEVEPRNGTPLNDATARLITLAEQGGYEKVAIIIMTDGHENASREYSVPTIKAKLDACRAKNWQIIFLGANFDNATQAASYGNMARHTVSSTSANLSASTSTMANKRAAYGVTGQSMSWSDEEKDQLSK
jgi:hypothetical protein